MYDDFMMVLSITVGYSQSDEFNIGYLLLKTWVSLVSRRFTVVPNVSNVSKGGAQPTAGMKSLTSIRAVVLLVYH